MSIARSTEIAEKGNYIDFTFHDEAVVAADGNIMSVNAAHNTLIIDIQSDVTNHTIAFKGTGASGTYKPLLGTNLETYATGITTNGKSEMWEIPIGGITNVMIDITALTAGGGTTTITGRAVTV